MPRTTLDPARDTVYAFLDRVFGEMAGVFPEATVHIGSDEVKGNRPRRLGTGSR